MTELEKKFMQLIVPEVHALFDKENVWEIVGGELSKKPTVDLLKVFIRAADLIEKNYREFVKGLDKDQSDDFYMDASRIFYDSVYGYLTNETDIAHWSRGGLFLASISSLAILIELGSAASMYIDDDEVPSIRSYDKFLKRFLK